MESTSETALSTEKLLEKYKAALGIAQKAKNARDEAIKNSKIIISENEALREKIKNLEKRYGTVEEMLAVLTDQKLKLAMEIDDLKKQNIHFIHELKSKEKIENELENLKQQNTIMCKEYEEFRNKCIANENEFILSKKDVDDLQKKNSTLKQLFGNIKSEKEDLDKSFKETLERLCELEEDQNVVGMALTKKYNTVIKNFKDWVEVITSSNEESYSEQLFPIDSKNSEEDNIIILTKEKENIDQEVLDLNERIANLRDELNIANCDRDKMMTNLEKVALETKQLIENSEKLTDEIDILKEEKSRQDVFIATFQSEKEILTKTVHDNEIEISRLFVELEETNNINQNLMEKIKDIESSFCCANSCEQPVSIDFLDDNINSVDIENTKRIELECTDDNPLKQNIIIQKERSVNSELNQLQEELQVFSFEISKHKQIAVDYEWKYKNALKAIDGKDVLINEQKLYIEGIKSRIASFEEEQTILSNNLSNCKAQLLSALEDLSHADEIKNKLKSASEEKDHKLAIISHELAENKSEMFKKVEIIENLNKELSTNNSILEHSNNEINLYKLESISKGKEIAALINSKNDLELTIKVIADENNSAIQKLKKEKTELTGIVSNYKVHNEELTNTNLYLNNQVKDLSSDKSNENLIQTLTSSRDSLQSELKEKENIVSNLGHEIKELHLRVMNLEQENKTVSSENCDLKDKIEELYCTHSKKLDTLTKKNIDLEEQLNTQLQQLNESSVQFTNLKDKINNLTKEIDNLKQTKDLLLDEKSLIREILKSSSCSLLDLNNKIKMDILQLHDKSDTQGQGVEKADTAVESLVTKNIVSSEENESDPCIKLKETISNSVNIMETLVIENRAIKSQLDEALQKSSNFSQELKKFESLQNDFEKQTSLIKELEKEISQLTKQNEELGYLNASLSKKIDKLNAECSTASSHCSSLKKQIEENKNARKIVIDEYNLQINILKESLAETEDKKDAIKEDNKEVIDKLNKQNSSLQNENSSLKEHICEKDMIIKSLEEQIQTAATSSSDEISYKTQLDKNEQLVIAYEEEIKSLKENLNVMSTLNEKLSCDIGVFEDNVKSLTTSHSEEIKFITNKNNEIQLELNNCNELLTFKSLELKENNKMWAGRFSSLKIALISLNKSRKEIKNQFECIENLFTGIIEHFKENLQEKVTSVVDHSMSAEKHELINEMHQMNQALKVRGESISKLQSAVSEYQIKIKQITTLNETIENELIKVKKDIEQHEELLKEKNIYIKQLEFENEQLKDSHDNTADSDVLSTSTVSRSEECSRLRDVEDSFEDRYTKLKLLAVKMKKRIMELTQTLETERNKMNTERIELQEKITSMSMAVKNAQKLQELFDQSLDDCDEQKKRNKVLETALDELKGTEDKLKSKITALETNNQSIPVMKKHIDSLNAVIKESKANLQKMQMENKAENIKYEELKKSNSKLETKLQELSRSLELAKQQGKSSNVLELEMKNYEKIVADLSSQLSMEKNIIKSLQSENEAILNVKVGLEEQIVILEKQIAVEEERNQHTNEQLSSLRINFEESSNQIDSLNHEIEILQKDLSHGKNKIEALTLEMSQITSEFSKKEMSMTSKIGSLQEQIRSLETSLVSTKQELATSKNEIQHLQEEYESYKLRAQTILSKRKGDFITHGEKEAKEEVERLKKDCKLLEEKLEAYTSEIDTLNTRKTSLTLEKARSDKKYEEMKIAFQQKISDYDLLNSEFYSYKITNETSIENLKDELSRKKIEYQSELSQQKKIIDELSSDFRQKEETISAVKSENSAFSFSYQDNMPLPHEREDGEGSESVPSPQTRRSSSSIVPLDILLNSPMVDENKVTVLYEQLEKLKNELTSYEVRCRHLSSLLSEAEKDSARNLHQNKILKEELRRLERSLERQPHVANTEYLKNIVFKFVTLPQGDERSRLIPVLDTLLKLSPEESHKLTSVAKGETQAGWSSYLPSWGGI